VLRFCSRKIDDAERKVRADTTAVLGLQNV
jgi:hypothetical protein